jgi:hypothetical protein
LTQRGRAVVARTTKNRPPFEIDPAAVQVELGRRRHRTIADEFEALEECWDDLAAALMPAKVRDAESDDLRDLYMAAVDAEADRVLAEADAE